MPKQITLKWEAFTRSLCIAAPELCGTTARFWSVAEVTDEGIVLTLVDDPTPLDRTSQSAVA